MNNWDIAAVVYGILALASLLPAVIPIFKKVALYPGGASFDQSPHFSEGAKKRLADNYSRIYGTLGFWKQHATIYKRFHYYCVYWTLLSSWLVPLLSTIGVEGAQRWLIVTISGHVALALSLHRSLKVTDMLRAFRLGESEFYDLHRRLLDRPHTFGEDEEKQLNGYFAAVEEIRRSVRSAEADSMPTVEQIKD